MAEKKSTKGKAAKPAEKKPTVRAKESKPASEVQPAVEPVLAQGINWAILGTSSTLITLIITAILFMIGWSYISNWYAYFGVGIEIVNIPLQQTLIYSTFTIILWMLSIGFSVFLYSVFLAIRGRSIDLLGENDWLIIISLSLIAIGLWDYYFWRGISRYITTIPLEIFYLWFLLIGLIFMVIFSPLYISLISYLRVRILRILNSKFQKSFRIDKPKFSYPSTIIQLKWIIICALAFVALMSLSAIIGISDASFGTKGFGGNVQKILVVSQEPLKGLVNVKISCNQDADCIYGPFGLILETENSIYLAYWRESGRPAFIGNSGLYILPRPSAQSPYFIVPAPTSSVTPVSTQSNITTATPANTVTPTSSQP